MFATIDYDLFTVASVCGLRSPSLHTADIQFTSITTSSLEVKKGSLFVPLLDKRDGHEFIEDALGRGAAAFFLKKGHPIAKKLPAAILDRAIVVADPLLALGQLALFHRRRFAPLVIAVTGSNGKTTTKEMLAQIFQRALGKKSIATEKNYNNHIGLPFSVFSIKPDTRVAIFEMGMNHAGEISYLSSIALPHVAVITSIGYAHIEFFASRAGIAAAKAEVTQNMPKGGLFYVPANVNELQTLTAAAKKHKIILKKVNPDKKIANYYGAWLSNFSLAAAVARDVGVDDSIITATAVSFKPAAGRMQLKKGYFTVIDDGYNANPDSAVASIDSAMQIAAGRPVVCVFGDFKEMGKFSRKLHDWTGREAAKKGVTAFYGVGKDMKSAVQEFQRVAGEKRTAFFFKRDQVSALIAQLKQEAKGSVILIKGSRSMQMEEIVELLT